jgi:hypothetical protein
MPWPRLVAEALDGYTCLWQDLDGLHVEAPPPDPPPTSILWAWAADGAMARVRLDGGRGYVATCPADVSTTEVLPWATDDGRVHAVRKAITSSAGLELRLEQYVDDGLDTGAGPITFLRERRA